MRKSGLLITYLFLCCIVFPSYSGFTQNHDLPQKIKGSWAGPLKFQSIELILVLNIQLTGNDSIVITIDSPDQGAKDLPTSEVILSNDSIIVKAKELMSVYKGAFNNDYTEITGTWKQGGMSFPLNLKRHEKKFTLNRPQEPKPPFPYHEEEAAFKNNAAGIDLAGTLTCPEGKGPFPAVVLITGSGPQNRDEELMGHKPFLVLADYLTRNGIAVLRYDDRGIGKSGGDFTTATTYDFAGDASSAVDFLKNRPEIDTTKIGIIGHSEGGMIAPMVASERKDIDFIILMAGPGLTGEKILLLQSELISRVNGKNEREIADEKKLYENIYSILKKNSDNDKATQKIKKAVDDFNKKHSKDKENEGLTPEQTDQQIRRLVSPWFRCFLTFDPVEYLREVKCPLLALIGELDLQVPPKENLQAIEKALIFGGNSSYVMEEIQGVNHLFQTATNGSPTEYSKIEETISPVVLEMITKWIKKTTMR